MEQFGGRPPAKGRRIFKPGRPDGRPVVINRAWGAIVACRQLAAPEEVAPEEEEVKAALDAMGRRPFAVRLGDILGLPIAPVAVAPCRFAAMHGGGEEVR